MEQSQKNYFFDSHTLYWRINEKNLSHVWICTLDAF
jgi:hypothetical protein